ncbi:PREDICTED: reticulon-like protein B7 [Tarenaya hassleriana]|uniref:reticulon-like protein B7 n=1 Tax=Tarenaya hassleriana TaxID=28532 RepID=UPI00053C14D1|nr:PREDICTED: reticulon-like protein B7 [Tarenaya hassleriana]
MGVEIDGPMEESMMESLVSERIGGQDSLSDDGKPNSPTPVKTRIYRMFGRERTVHKVCSLMEFCFPCFTYLSRCISDSSFPCLQTVSAFIVDLNCAFAVLRRLALERDLKMFLMVVAGLWLVSIIGNWFSFLSLVYFCFVRVHTVPKLYEKYEDDIDPIAEKAVIEIEKRYQSF